MCKVYGYCRISTAKQSIDRQVRNIQALYPDAIIVKEAYTGTKIQGRAELDKLLKTVKNTDKIVFDSVSRMSRNEDEGFTLYKDLFNKGIELEFIREPHINTSTYREALEKQINAIKTGDEDTDELMKSIIDGINHYILRLAEKQIKLAFNQASKEVEDLHQRTKEGIETARRNGKQIGAVKGKKLNIKKEAPTKDLIRKYCKDFEGNLNDLDCIKLIGVSRNTYYKYKREMKEGI